MLAEDIDIDLVLGGKARPLGANGQGPRTILESKID